jgi:MATE family multidrug resistance protein
MAPAMICAWVANGVNVVANWALIYGHLGFEARGVIGAGIATSFSRAFMLVALVAMTWAGRLHEDAWVAWSRRAFDVRGMRVLVRHGLAVSAQVGLEVWGFHAATFLAGMLGAPQLAAHIIVLQMAAMAFMVPLGISVAATTRVGNLTGAGDEPGARHAAWVALALGGGVMTFSATAFTLLRWQLPRLWAPEDAVLALAAGILPIAATFQVFDGTQAVGCGVLRGRGDTMAAAVFNAIGYYALALPLAWLLGFRFGLGLPGIWWGLVLGLMTVATLLVWRIARRH